MLMPLILAEPKAIGGKCVAKDPASTSFSGEDI